MSSKKKLDDFAVYKIKVTLRDIRPPIWRRFQVKDDISLHRLHGILQVVMGWDDCHLHKFIIKGESYGIPEPEFGFEVIDERRTKLRKVVSRKKAKFEYNYDFGDDWRHEILVEDILEKEPGMLYPVCIKGKRDCPPEDCGGVWRYMNLLEVMGDPEHEDHESMMEWLGDGFDPEWFDLEDINDDLKEFRITVI